ncbi:hypothetical protein HMI49_20570 [Corallococcus exercitus]|uniref:Uncharacterized protein n=1 Tax=Corallococcus exercitus TaxID=2316736 RepID=A0A7Y4KMQ2_9BACT|nr:hypothetical protein [Corallococcus exercitus]NOK35599.1 hypothetical protein [Corallococcus exercitus]
MVIVLKRTIEVRGFHVIGEVGFAQSRAELRAVAQLAASRAGQLSARELCEHLLGSKPDAVGLRLLSVCEQMGLIAWDLKPRGGESLARLTEEGRRVAEGGDVFVPERGAWTVWVAKDPLIPLEASLLRIDPFQEPTAFDEIGRRDAPRQKRATVDLPDWVQRVCKSQGRPGWGDGRAVAMLDIEAKGEPVVESKAQVELSLCAAPHQASSLRLEGTVDGQNSELELPHAPAPGFEEVWRYCLGTRAHDWDGERLAVRFEGLDGAELSNFKSHIAFDHWLHPQHGAFGRVQVPHVPIRPATDIDASRWANWLLDHRVQSYVTKADFTRRCEEVQETFAGYRLQLMTQEQLAVSLLGASGGRPGRKYWHLQAPLDWSL